MIPSGCSSGSLVKLYLSAYLLISGREKAFQRVVVARTLRRVLRDQGRNGQDEGRMNRTVAPQDIVDQESMHPPIAVRQGMHVHERE